MRSALCSATFAVRLRQLWARVCKRNDTIRPPRTGVVGNRLTVRGGHLPGEVTLRIEIFITAPRAAGKSVVAHTIAKSLRKMGFTDIEFTGVDGAKARTLLPQQTKAKITIHEQIGRN